MEGFSKTFVVDTKATAKAVGSGELDVLSTPALLAMVENTAKEHLHTKLAPEETSVGTKIDVRHLRPSKVGADILVQIDIHSQETSKINFSFTVYDNEQLVATGTHQRAVILTDVFMNKLK